MGSITQGLSKLGSGIGEAIKNKKRKGLIKDTIKIMQSGEKVTSEQLSSLVDSGIKLADISLISRVLEDLEPKEPKVEKNQYDTQEEAENSIGDAHKASITEVSVGGEKKYQVGAISEDDDAEPSWAQTQKVEAVRSAFDTGSFAGRNAYGEIESLPVTNRKEAILAIQYNKLDPDLFTDELNALDEEPVEIFKRGKLKGTVQRKDLQKYLKADYTTE